MKNCSVSCYLSIFLACVSLAFSSCNRQSPSAGSCSFDLSDLYQSTPLFSYVTDYDVTVLQMPGSDSVSTIRKIVVWDEDYVVLERTGRILRFDSTGMLKSSKTDICPVRATDMLVSGGCLYVLADKEITAYDCSWTKTESIELEYSSTSFYISEGGLLVTAGASSSDGMVVHTYTDGKLLNSSLHFSPKEMIAMSMKEEGWSVRESEGRLLLSLPLCETIYEISDGKAVPYFTFKSGKSAKRYIKKNATNDPEEAPGFWKGMEEKYFVPEMKVSSPSFHFLGGYYDHRMVTLFYDRATRYAAPYTTKASFLAVSLFSGRFCHPQTDDTFIADLSMYTGWTLDDLVNETVWFNNEFEIILVKTILSKLGYCIESPITKALDSFPAIPESEILDNVVLVKCKVR